MSINLSSNGFFKDQGDLALTTNFKAIDFKTGSREFRSIHIVLASDSGIIEYSLNGTDTHGKLTNGEIRIMPGRSLARIYLKGATGGESYRLEVY